LHISLTGMVYVQQQDRFSPGQAGLRSTDLLC